MNKKYDRTDQERDQSRRLEQGDAEKQQAREDGKPERGGQQQAGDEPRRQQGGWQTDEDRRADKSGAVRDGESGREDRRRAVNGRELGERAQITEFHGLRRSRGCEAVAQHSSPNLWDLNVIGMNR